MWATLMSSGGKAFIRRLALQGIPDEYDEADVNRLFSGEVLHIPYSSCPYHQEALLKASTMRLSDMVLSNGFAMARFEQLTAGRHV